MGIIKRLFGSQIEVNNISNLDWNLLSDLTQLDTIAKDSNTKTQVIFKHSTRCGISSGVLRKFEKQFGASNSIVLHFLDLLRYRDISNEIASRFDVAHQSPQLLVIKNGVVAKYDSHYGILELDIAEYQL